MNKIRSIFTKIFFGYISIIIILTGAIIYFSFDIINENYKNNLINEQNYLTHTIDKIISPIIDKGDLNILDSTVKDIGKDLRSRITIIEKNGKVIADSKANPKSMENHLDRPEVVSAITNGFGTAIRHSFSVDKDMMYVASPLKINDKKVVITRLSVFMDDYITFINNLEQNILKIILISLFITIFLAIILSKTITKPINILVSDTNKVAEGDFSIRSNIKTNDELELLGNSFNKMIEKLDELFTQTVNQKDELNKIISSIQEGLVVIDKSGIITLSNESFNNIIGLKSLKGKSYKEVIRDENVIKIIKNMIISNTNITNELEFKGEYYICNGNLINDNNELVIIFNNISNLKKLENIKRDFVVNVSHELRTPLTVINGYIETLEDEVDDKNKKYVNIIKNHTKRLINIVQDLLIISELEQKNTTLDISEVNVTELVENLKSTFEQKLKEKNINLNFNIENDLHGFYADSFKLDQIFINLIDNSIKYSEKGSIEVQIKKEDSNIKIEISDTGLGIPEKDQERIFERFYTVDKSRSRQYSGTGLGLSIVKHIVNLHKGKIELVSKLNNGSKFIITLPKNQN